MRTRIADTRNFAYLNWKQVDALPRDRTLLILPTAAIEQHGPHLPLATDTLINNELLGRALDLLPAEAPVYALPPVCYGKSNEHLGFPGTLSVSSSTFIAVLRDLGASLAAAGFRRLAIFNTHGGNSSLVDVMARDLRAEFGLRTFTIFGSAGATFEGLNPQERAYGFHAGELETAFLLATTPELVNTSAYTANYIASINHKPLLAPENGAANFAWLTRDIAASGVMGDPRPATAENGELWLNAAARRIAAVLREILEFREPVQSTGSEAKA
ncbi:MAG: creatininase family protein [Alloacidobacterium sp.]|jgi:creatinine amidohydrolase